MTQADVANAFEVMGITPIERDMRELRDLIAPLRAPADGDSRVVYRTVLANGTGKLPPVEDTHAQLERNAL